MGERERDEHLDRLTAIRRRACPVLHRVTEPFGGYVECTMHPSEYVGTVERTLGRFRSDLRSMGFHREPIAALKRHSDGRASAGSWVFRRSLFADEQLHVTVFRAGSDRIDTYAHWEHSWIRHPIKHYRAHGWNTSAGVSTMRSLLREHDIAFRLARTE
ncbi:hypothetical protein [Natrarchaeobius oligotrophus]|uniref:Uncharacterized protein n=1 Tax=Natrarchaeobius chitinivorans TaxID=1679083 RepID=A0A3N6NJ96_NATCH|nr:hypothetical protein [Natrarchaeobius chitinivorans]RQG99232.1 hypothetical protein EA472_15320 [Natrarchaeobius chitinivorans]